MNETTLLPPLKGFYEAFDTGNVESLDEFISLAWVDNTLPPGRNPGREGMKQAILALRGAVPDLHCSVEAVLSSGDIHSVRIIFSGTHTGPFLGAPPTGHLIRFIAFDMHRIADGRIVESWHLEDNITVLQQMGILPAPEESRQREASNTVVPAAPSAPDHSSDNKVVLDSNAAPAIPFSIPGATEGGVTAQLLNIDGSKGLVATIIHITAGAQIPAHYHKDGSEAHYVLDGDFRENGVLCPPGTYLTHAANVVHGPHSSEQGCRVLTLQSAFC